MLAWILKCVKALREPGYVDRHHRQPYAPSARGRGHDSFGRWEPASQILRSASFSLTARNLLQYQLNFRTGELALYLDLT